MKRLGMTVLVLSLALNLGFGLAWFSHRHGPAPRPGSGEEWGRGMHGKPGAQRGAPRGEWAQRRAHRLHRELGLKPERREQLRASLQPLEPEIADTRRLLLRARRDFANALHVEDPSRETVMLLHGEVSQLQARLDSLVAEALLREADILHLEERKRSGPWSSHHEEGHAHEEKRR